MSHAILICDDDPDIRGAMKRTLRGYVVTETSSPREARDVMKTRRFDAVISGDRDIEVAARAVNDGAVHRSFSKPRDDEKLRAALEIVLRFRPPGGG